MAQRTHSHSNEHTTTEELLDVFSTRAVSYQRKVCMCIHPIAARQWHGKYVPAATNTSNNTIIFGHVVFYAVYVASNSQFFLELLVT
jgi:hypothetical protein